jgi:hypothetical protein
LREDYCVDSRDRLITTMLRSRQLKTFQIGLVGCSISVAPTRLLDWRHSFYVGLYFAVRDLSQGDDGEGALWAMDWPWIESEIHGAGREIFERDRNLREEKHFRELLGPGTQPCILKINAFQLNLRLVVQQGTFLVPR